MANCEYRLGNPTPKSVDAGASEPVFVAVSGGKPICRVKAEGGNQIYPVCELPDMAGEDCPIAMFQRGEITLDQANARLMEISNIGKQD